jgi:hypothetical protein
MVEAPSASSVRDDSYGGAQQNSMESEEVPDLPTVQADQPLRPGTSANLLKGAAMVGGGMFSAGKMLFNGVRGTANMLGKFTAAVNKRTGEMTVRQNVVQEQPKQTVELMEMSIPKNKPPQDDEDDDDDDELPQTVAPSTNAPLTQPGPRPLEAETQMVAVPPSRRLTRVPGYEQRTAPYISKPGGRYTRDDFPNIREVMANPDTIKTARLEDQIYLEEFQKNFGPWIGQAAKDGKAFSAQFSPLAQLQMIQAEQALAAKRPFSALDKIRFAGLSASQTKPLMTRIPGIAKFRDNPQILEKTLSIADGDINF